MPVPLGTWDLPSGNRVEIYPPDPPVCKGKLSLIKCLWERDPSNKDKRYYKDVIVKEMRELVSAYMETPGNQTIYWAPGEEDLD